MNTEQQQDYIKFAAAAEILHVRFQQVYQRAVVRKKMRWVEQGKSKLVHKADVQAWLELRKALNIIE